MGAPCTRVASVRTVVLAELEVFHNRPFSPTRRIALGRRDLPIDPPPGFGAVLLGGIAAVAAEELDGEERDGLRRLIHHLEHGHRVPQPQVRHRFQVDTHGLGPHARPCSGATARRSSSTSTATASPIQLTLGAVYAAGQLAHAGAGPACST